MKKLKEWFENKNKVCDVLFLSGTAIIIITTFFLNIYIGLYLLALVLIASAFFMFKFK